MEGSLDSIMLPDILTFLSLIKKTGRLELHHQDVEKTFFWKRGEVVFAHSTDREESLGLFLLRNGKITPEQYKESVESLKPGSKHGKTLVKMGFITPKELWWGVKNQVLEIIYSAFSLNEGRFYFYEMPDSLVRQSIVIGTSTTSLIMEGIRRLDEWVRIRERIPRKEICFSRIDVHPEVLDNLELSPVEWKVMELIQPDRNVSDIIRLSGLSEFDTSRIILTLLTGQLIVVHEESRIFDKEGEDLVILQDIIQGYCDLYHHMFLDLKESLGPGKATEIFREVLERQQTSSGLFNELRFDEEGVLSSGGLMANVAELPFEERMVVLDDALNTLLSYLLFELSQVLPAEKKESLYHDVSERKARLDQILNIEDFLT